MEPIADTGASRHEAMAHASHCLRIARQPGDRPDRARNKEQAKGVAARAVGDDLPEAVESEGPNWMLGVQWHPEADPTSTIIAALVDAARGY